MDTIKQYLHSVKQNRIMRRRLTAFLIVLSLIVSVGVAWSLHLIGETISKKTYCGLEEHIHSEECIEKVLICGFDTEESAEAGSEPASSHVHTDECYEITYICGYDYEHTHTLSCYSNLDADMETAADWEKTFADVEMTGVYADDVLAVAKTQLGYTESADNYATAVDENGEEYITGGYTRYGAWYGEPYDGWDAMFVSFCLHYAGVPATAFPIDSSCENWVKTLSDPEEGYELYKNAADYSPYPGDIVFFDTDQDGVADRVGIVSGLTPEYAGSEEYYEDDPDYTLTGFTTIEGDSDDKVAKCSYDLTDETILGYGTLSLVYGTAAQAGSYIEVDNATSVEKFKLWIYSATSGGSMVVDRGEGNEITDAYTYTDTDGNVYYLVPFTYLDAVKDQLEYFSFDENNCPFVYAPSAFYPSENLTDAVYAKYNGNWYVRVQDTGIYDNNIPRSNIYYDVSKEVGDYFTLTYNGVELKVHVVDTKGNPIYGNYSQYSMTLEAATKYLFEANASDTTSKLIPIPTIDDYTYSGTHITSYSGVSVVSVATSGYPLDNGSGTLGSNFRFYSAGGNDGNGGYYTRGSETVYLVYAPKMHLVTDVADANSTAVNLFDYWLTTRDASDYHQNGNDLGINAGHTLKFHYSTSDAVGTLNKWTGSGGGVLQGIVQNTLVNNFPALSGNTALGMTADNVGESLDYLFDPSVTNDYKASYRNVQGLFQIDSNGYFYYNARDNFAEFDAETNRFNLYEESGVANSDTSGLGMFFPFNTIDETYPLSSAENSILNHYFGLSLTTRFIQNYEGHTDAMRTTPTTFQFAGDDDVWIFIDDVLVADLGGIHDATGVTIDFAAGTVTVNNVYDGQSGDNPVTTYFSDIFKDTSVSLAKYSSTDTNGVTTEYTTFENNTTHVLRFFYLERGNASSNLYLRYNLTDIPDTSLYKVDQYGSVVAGATFATYKYDSTEGKGTSDFDEFGYITDEGTVVSLKYLTEEESPDGLAEDHYYVDPVTGKITVNKSGNTYTITPAYVGETDSKGEMSFLDSDGMAYSQAELKGMFGEYFILREIKVPDGYRTVSDDVILYFQDELLQCYAPYSTGVWANPNALITATNTLYIADNYGNTVGDNNTPIEYYNPVTGESKGTLFAVVLKRNMDTSTAITPETVTSWLPVYGDDDTGYHTVSFGDGTDYETQLAAVLAAAKLSDKLSNVEFAYSTDGMQVLFENLPGSATRYYSYMVNHNDEFTTTDPQYLIAYYYTTEDSLDEANTSNTVRIRSHGGKANDGTVYSAFNGQWGATVEIPNIVNALYFQKADKNGDLLDNAVFALYGAETDSAGNGYYVGTDADGNKVYIRLDEANGTAKNGKATVYTSLPASLVSGGTAGTYTICTDFDIPTQGSGGTGYITDSGAGVITVTAGGKTYTVTPALNAQSQSLVGYTHDVCATVSESGTGHFMYIKTGNYFMKEIACPAGYDVNRVNIPVEVTGEGVYANAGTVNNNVRVGNGIGYLVKTMDVFASPSEIDETLCWVYSHLKVESSSNADFLSDLDNTFYVHSGLTNNYAFDGFGVSNGQHTNYIPVGALTNGSGVDALTNSTNAAEGAMTQFMRYDGLLAETTDKNKIFDYALYKDADGNVRGVQSYRLWTESGWSDLAIYQDYAYGSNQISTNAGNPTADATTAYTDLTGYGEISYLFSSSTFVQVTDEYSYGNLEISKTVLPDTDEAFTFTLTLTNENAKNIIPLTGIYKYTVYDVTVGDDGTETRTVAKTTGEDGKEVDYIGEITIAAGENNVQTGSLTVTLKNNQVLVIENLPYGAAYTVTETLPAGNNLPYTTWVSVNGGARAESLTGSGTLVWRTDADDVDTNVYNVDYTNALLPLVKIIKVDSLNKEAALAGAKFVMYRIRADSGTTEYYSDGKWVVLENGKSEEDYAVTTDEAGELLFANMDANGTYYLKELAPPDGYWVLAEPIEFTVANGVIVSPTEKDASTVYEVTGIQYEGQLLNLMVMNNTGYELPKSGGVGTILYTAGGLGLILAAGAGFTCRRRKRIRDRRRE